MRRLFGILFTILGLFAILGGLYTWGEGSIFYQVDLHKVLIPWADIVVTGPLSLLAGYGILRKRHWAVAIGVATSGIYIFGSTLVFITLIWEGNSSLDLLVPALLGIFIGTVFILLCIKKQIS